MQVVLFLGFLIFCFFGFLVMHFLNLLPRVESKNLTNERTLLHHDRFLPPLQDDASPAGAPI
jgi:hypothetical protein